METVMKKLILMVLVMKETGEKEAFNDDDDGYRFGVIYDPSTPQPKPQVRMMMTSNDDDYS